jgi:altronate dehydratase small subunit
MNTPGVQKPRALVLDTKDNVATALALLSKGTAFSIDDDSGSIGELTAKQDIALGHKIARTEIRKGWHVIKYGSVIGVATQDIGIGCHVHTHNVNSLRGRKRYSADTPVSGDEE